MHSQRNHQFRVHPHLLQNDRRQFWSLEEHQKYVQFLEDNFEEFNSYTGFKGQHLFKKMAKFIGTRDHKKCRSHHQKMKRKRTITETI